MIPKKIFISYSHKDETLKDELVKHLSTLKRAGKVSEWNDRKIIAGTEWDHVISENLLASNIVLFLVSPDFISSKYCYEQEVLRAMEMHDSNETVVMPLILRPCDWKNTPFAKIQGTPKNGEPVILWNNQDSAFLNFIEYLRTALEEHPLLNRPEVLKSPTVDQQLINEKFIQFLSDTEIKFSHRNAFNIALDDIYTHPTLRVHDNNISKIERTRDASSLFHDTSNIIIFGDEQSGKTALAKQIFKDALAAGHLPLYLNGGDCKKKKIDRTLEKTVTKVYRTLTPDQYFLSENKVRVLIVDDFCATTYGRTEISEFLNNIKSQFAKIYIFANDSFRYVTGELPCFDSFIAHSLLPFSNEKREELVGKWLNVGKTEVELDSEFYQLVDQTKSYLDDFVRKASVPSKPIFLLSILQSLESATPQRLEHTTYGYCYHYLVQKALERINISADKFDKFFNFLTEIAGEIYSKSERYLTKSGFQDFKEKYEDTYIGINFETVLDVLDAASILDVQDDLVRFKYKYIYYYFVGKKFADSITNAPEKTEIISRLIENLHREEDANILIFITHHTKSKWILDEIQIALLGLFENETPADLTPPTLEYIKNFINELPAIILEQRAIVEERKKANETQDHQEESEREATASVEELDSNELLAQINRLFRAIELTGQIIRNKHGSLQIDLMRSFVDESYSASLRFLGFFLRTTDAAKNEVIDGLSWMILHDKQFNKHEAELRARKLFLAINYGVIHGMIHRIAVSVGSKEAVSIHRKIAEEYPSPAILLITQIIELHYTKTINVTKIKSIYHSFEDNPVLQRILKQVVLSHIYMHPVDYKVQQQLSAAVEIPVNQINMMKAQNKLRI